MSLLEQNEINCFKDTRGRSGTNAALIQVHLHKVTMSAISILNSCSKSTKCDKKFKYSQISIVVIRQKSMFRGKIIFTKLYCLYN